MRRLLVWLAITVAIGVSPARADAEADARKLAGIFCLLGKEDGQFGRLYLVTKSLNAVIADAMKKNDEIAAAKPGQPTPLGNGVPFQSFPKDPPACMPGKFTDTGRTQIIEIAYEFPDTADNWTDRLVLITEDGRPRVDDILFGIDDSGNSLRKTLADLFKK
jgi:hypothetical protein